MFTLKPQQQQACREVYIDLRNNVDSTLAVMATGFGKTVTASALAKRWTDEGKRVLFLAHRDELLRQAQSKFWEAREVVSSIEKAGEFASLGAEVVIGSVQTMQGDRLKRWPENHFDIIIIDEAHRSVAKTYLNVYERFNNAQRLGLTATAYRAKGSLANVYEKISYEFNLRDAINAGILCPLVAQTIPLKLDMTGVKSTSGDYGATEIADSIEPLLEQVAAAVKVHAADRKIMVFTPVCATAKMCKEVFAKIGFRTYYAGGDDRSEVAAFEADGPGSIMFNSMLFTEGYDHPQIDCIIVLRPTKSTGLYMQMIGRGTRLFIGKRNCLILDFLWNFAKNDICKPSCLIAESEEEADEIDKIIDEKGAPMDILKEAEVEAVKNIQNDRERKLASTLHECSQRGSKKFDPVIESLSIYDLTIPEYKPAFEWEKKPVTDAQLKRLESDGFKKLDGWNTGFASKIITGLDQRSSEGLCTPKQMRALMRGGNADAPAMTRNEASKAMDKLMSKIDKSKRYKNYKKARGIK